MQPMQGSVVRNRHACLKTAYRWDRELVPQLPNGQGPAALGNRLRMYEDIPIFWGEKLSYRARQCLMFAQHVDWICGTFYLNSQTALRFADAWDVEVYHLEKGWDTGVREPCAML